MIIALSIVILSLSSCVSSGVHYRYKYSNDQKKIENNGLTARIQMLSNTMLLELWNETDSNLIVNWDELTLVIDSIAIPLEHLGAAYQEGSGPLLPPHAKMVDIVVPKFKLNPVIIPSGAPVPSTEKYSFFPTYDFYNAYIRDYIKSLKGENLVIYLSIDRGSGREVIEFEMMVTEIIPDHNPGNSVYQAPPGNSQIPFSGISR